MSTLTITAGLEIDQRTGEAEKFVCVAVGGNEHNMTADEARKIARNIIFAADQVDEQSIEQLKEHGVSDGKLQGMARAKILDALLSGKQVNGESFSATSDEWNAKRQFAEEADECNCLVCRIRRAVVEATSENESRK